jgi:glutamate synthase (NADPH/NADH) small chain
MGKPTGFLEFKRAKAKARPVDERVRDWKEVYLLDPVQQVREQGARCMDCGIPFCHQGCPLGNLIPDWNDLSSRDHWRAAIDRLHATNNFPEWTGRLCPAPCEGACVLGINDDPVTIKSIELSIVERAFLEGWIVPRPPARRTGKAVVFRPGSHIGVDVPTAALRRDFDAIVLCCGATTPRDLKVPGRELAGIHFAVDYLTQQNRLCASDAVPPEEIISAAGRRVVIIGGGDTGADCLGTAHRQGARSVHQFELLSRPPEARAEDNPWPLWPNVFRTSSAHEEGGERVYSVSTERFHADGNGRVRALEALEVEMVREAGRLQFSPKADTRFELETDLVLLAMGFLGPEQNGLVSELGVRVTERGNVWRDEQWMTSEKGVFTAGDMQRGQSLIVWAIADGRQAARAVDTYLMGHSELP